METVQRTLSLELAKPLNVKWAEARVLLYTQRKVVAQLLRAGMDARIAAGSVGTSVAHLRLCPDARGKSRDTVVYQSMLAEMEKIKRGKWSKEARPALEIAAKTIANLSRKVKDQYQLRPSYRGSQPIPVAAADVDLAEDDQGRIKVRLKLLKKGSHEFAIRASKGTHWETLRKIVAGELKHGAAGVVYSERKNKWYLQLSYKAPVQRVPGTQQEGVSLVVRRGAYKALSMMGTDGSYYALPGNKIVGQLRQLTARIAKARSIGEMELGHGAKGHGKRRRYEHLRALGDKRARVRKTWCQQAGATVVQKARRAGASEVVIEDFGGFHDELNPYIGVRFPFYALKQSIVHACEKAGITVREVSAAYISTTCPGCGALSDRAHNRRTGVFHCDECGLERPADWVANLNLMRSSEVDTSVWDERMKQYEKLVAQARLIQEGVDPVKRVGKARRRKTKAVGLMAEAK